MRRVLKKNFFNRPTLRVAEELLGKFLVRRKNGKEIALMITEVEAYDGFSDRASHAHRGKTQRNYPMFGEAANWYVYFTYGMHWMLNIVTGKKDYPAAVLVRGGVLIHGRTGELHFVNGPGKLTKFLGIDKRLNVHEAAPKTGLWVEDRGIKKKNLKIYPPKIFKNKFWRIKKGPRIGIRYAGPVWSKRKYRFYLGYDSGRLARL